MFFLYCIHGPKEEQPCVEVGPPWLNKVESESESEIAPRILRKYCQNFTYL